MTTEIALNAKEYGLEPSKAEQIEAVFAPMVSRFKELEADYTEVMTMPIDHKSCAEAKRVRLSYVKVRTATDKIHKDAKESLLIQTRAIDGLRNIVKFAAIDHENSLEERENHFQKLEEQRKKQLHEDRTAEIQKYGYEGSLNFSEFTEEVWSNFLAGTKANYEARIEAEQKAERERIEADRRAKLNTERRGKIVRLVNFIEDYDNVSFADLTEPEFFDIVQTAEKRKAEHEAEQDRIRKENERLQKEREEIERKAKAEKEAADKKLAAQRKALEDKVRKEREAHEAQMKAERETARKEAEKAAAERAKLEAEIKAKLEAEEAQKKAKAEADYKAASAPDKEKLIAFAKQINAIPFPELSTDQAVEISKNVQQLLIKVSDYITKKTSEL